MGYSKVEIFGGANVNYLHTRSYAANSAEIDQVEANGLYLPEWDRDTAMLASYQNSLDASSISIDEGSVVEYKVQRLDVRENIMYHITDTSEIRLQDYNVSSGQEYRYYIFPMITINDAKTLGAPIITDVVTPEWSGCTIVGLAETGRKNEYRVDEDNIWFFEADVEPDDYVLNMDKSFADGFGRFPKRNQGQKQYITGGMSALVGTVDCASSSIKGGISKVEKWEAFCHSPNLKLFKDVGGRILPVDIREESCRYSYYGSGSPVSTSFSIVQMADYKEISVYGTAVQ